jgi:hypothetical protein
VLTKAKSQKFPQKIEKNLGRTRDAGACTRNCLGGPLRARGSSHKHKRDRALNGPPRQFRVQVPASRVRLSFFSIFWETFWLLTFCQHVGDPLINFVGLTVLYPELAPSALGLAPGPGPHKRPIIQAQCAPPPTPTHQRQRGLGPPTGSVTAGVRRCTRP